MKYKLNYEAIAYVIEWCLTGTAVVGVKMKQLQINFR